VTLTLGGLRWTSPFPSLAPNDKPTCTELSAQSAEFEEGEVPLEIAISTGEAAIDRVEITPAR
jgi:hypothetical protein